MFQAQGTERWRDGKAIWLWVPAPSAGGRPGSRDTWVSTVHTAHSQAR